MSKSLDIALTCSIAAQGALQRYPELFPSVPYSISDFIPDWNRALLSVMRRPEFKRQLGPLGRAVVAVRGPNATSWVLDHIAVPYRSYYYVRRMLNAYYFSIKRLYAAGGTKKYINVVDFGRGLSPLCHIIKSKFQMADIHTFDSDITNNIFAETTNLMRLPMPRFNMPVITPSYEDDVFLSLGTFVYMPMDDQVAQLKYATENFRNLHIELEMAGDNAPDAKLVQSLGTSYQPGWHEEDIAKIIGTHDLVKNDWRLYSLVTRNPMGLDNMATMRAYNAAREKFGKSIMNATEYFLQR